MCEMKKLSTNKFCQSLISYSKDGVIKASQWIQFLPGNKTEEIVFFPHSFFPEKNTKPLS